MTDLVYSEMIGWYDPSEAFCVADDCHDPAYDSKISGMVETDLEIDGDKTHFVYLAYCKRHYEEE